MDKWVKLITAKEANELTRINANKYKYKILKKLNRLIKTACYYRESYIATKMYISDELAQDLRDLGYHVEYQFGDNCVIISWNQIDE